MLRLVRRVLRFWLAHAGERPPLSLFLLEDRTCPALFDPTSQPGFVPIPGFTGAVVDTVGNFYPGHLAAHAYIPAASSGGASHLIIYDGGEAGPLVPSGQYEGGTEIDEPKGVGTVLFSGFVYNPAFTGGEDVDTLRIPGQPDKLVITPGPGGGNQVVVFTPGTGEQYSFLAYGDATFRGGLTVQAGAEYPGGPDVFTVLPMAGGAPRVGIYAADGTPLADFFVGSVAFRQTSTPDLNYSLAIEGGPILDPATQQLPTAQQVYVFQVFNPLAPGDAGQSSTLWTYAGEQRETYPYSPNGLGGFGDPPFVG